MEFQEQNKDLIIQSYVELTSRCLDQSAEWILDFLPDFKDQIITIPPQPAKILHAQNLFRIGEFKKAIYALKEFNDQRAIGIKLLSKLIFIQRENEQNMSGSSNRLGTLVIPNDQAMFKSYENVIQEANQMKNDFDSLNNYIYSAILFKGGRYKESISPLVKSLNEFPLNRSGWKLLNEILVRFDDSIIARTLTELKDSWPKTFFQIELLAELQQTEAAIQLMSEMKTLPRNGSIIALEATVYYHNRDFDRSQSLFEELRKKDPYRMESLELYSNLLFVKDEIASLSELSLELSKIDKFRPETLIVSANFFSINGKHEEAISLFAMAIKLDSSFAFAWTLIGHEFIELDNISAAITAYKYAYNSNPRDHRALYGLGRAYEISKMYYHAIIYYKKAVAIYPFDSRVWLALGFCYQELSETDNAIRCYQRAVYNIDNDGIAIYRLATLYEDVGDIDRAAYCYETFLDKYDNSDESKKDYVKNAISFLSQYYRNKGKLEKAKHYAQKLLFDPNTVAEGNALIRDIRSEEQNK